MDTFKNFRPFENKWVLVTGVKKGRVGEDVAHGLAALGANLFLHYRSHREEVEEIVREIEKLHGVTAMIVEGDLAKKIDVEGIVATMAKTALPDYVIHNAAAFEPLTLKSGDPLREVLENLDHNLDGNLRGPYLLTYALVEAARKAGKVCTFFFVGDAFIDRGGAYPANKLAYATSKAALETMVRTLAAAYGKEGFRFLGGFYGPIKPVAGKTPEKAIESIRSEINLPGAQIKDWLGGAAIAHDLALLLLTRTIQGEMVRLDGGREWTVEDEHAG